ncbi:hypothetical protein C5167_018033 [Papaver somniferum]|uniref:Uncharacterized protein n=1 Tax=Papaver somniferum TaxID=3469 RepID=A0A4Y7INB1_PAPSO|nr:hypothetical protein C5167_018033 [Papaver somniferum]
MGSRRRHGRAHKILIQGKLKTGEADRGRITPIQGLSLKMVEEHDLAKVEKREIQLPNHCLNLT